MFFVYCDGECMLITPNFEGPRGAQAVMEKFTEYGHFSFVSNILDFERDMIALPVREQDKNRFLESLMRLKSYQPQSTRQPSFKY